jgi:hypothetical protein
MKGAMSLQMSAWVALSYEGGASSMMSWCYSSQGFMYKEDFLDQARSAFSPLDSETRGE